MTANEKLAVSPNSAKAQPSRLGKKSIGGHFDNKVAQTLRILAAQLDTTTQVLLAQAINDLFEKHGFERLADETALPRGAAARRKND